MPLSISTTPAGCSYSICQNQTTGHCVLSCCPGLSTNFSHLIIAVASSPASLFCLHPSTSCRMIILKCKSNVVTLLECFRVGPFPARTE